MKTVFAALIAILASSAFGAEYLHLRNERDSEITYAVDGIAGIRKVILQPKESVSFRFPSRTQKVELLTPSGRSSGSGGIFVVEANQSPEVGGITLDHPGSYPILRRVIEVVGSSDIIQIKEQK